MAVIKKGREQQKQERLGEVGYNISGDRMIITKYNSATDIIVQFDNGYSCNSEYAHFKRGKIMNPIKNSENRIGEVNYNNFGSEMIIIEYNKAEDIVVQFQDKHKYKTKANYAQFKNGQVRNPYDKSVYGVGYLGEGEYKTSINKKLTTEYKIWRGMLMRCYYSKYQEKYPTYKGCSVCEDWHNFQAFCDWFSKNYYEIDDNVMNLDKDILHKGNKIYSPENCAFVPQNINKLFLRKQKSRGNYPIGVHYDNKTNSFIASFGNGKGKVFYLGHFPTPEEAFYLGYKPYKKSLIKEIADKYKDKIPERIYNALCVYKIEITD